MATGQTPLRKRPYPEETDTPDVAADMESLAVALDTAPVVGVGALASRPSSGMVAGDRYLVSGDSTPGNNNAEHIYTGSAWTIIPHPPIGALMQWAGTGDPADPDGVTRWLVCDGRAISRTSYAALYATLLSTYGSGDGSTTFNIPDLRGRVAVGVDSGGVHLPSNHPALAASGGEENHTLSQAEMPVHNHGVNDPSHGHNVSPAIFVEESFVYILQNGSTGYNIGPSSGSPIEGSYTGISIQNAGSGGAHNNLQPYLAVNHIIRVQ